MDWFTMPTSFIVWCSVASVGGYEVNIFLMYNAA